MLEAKAKVFDVVFSGQQTEHEPEHQEFEQGSIEVLKGHAVESPIQWKLPTFEAQDSLITINLQTLEEPRMTTVSGLQI